MRDIKIMRKVTEWEKKLRQEVCDEYCPDDEGAYCSHRKKEEKCVFNKDIREILKYKEAWKELKKRLEKDFIDEICSPKSFEEAIEQIEKERGIE